MRSRPARGAWVEIIDKIKSEIDEWGRAPQGARGLKLNEKTSPTIKNGRRAPQGARGLKFQRHGQQNYNYSRAPQGARGLKFKSLSGGDDQ